jgi:hypothetical protein
VFLTEDYWFVRAPLTGLFLELVVPIAPVVMFATEPWRFSLAGALVDFLSAGAIGYLCFTLLYAVFQQSSWMYPGDEPGPVRMTWPEPHFALVVVLHFAMRVASLIAAFASVYLQATHESKSCFGVQLNHIDSIYFTVTTFTTTGYGDYHPQSGPCKLLVSGHMLLALVLLGIGIATLGARVLADFQKREQQGQRPWSPRQ